MSAAQIRMYGVLSYKSKHLDQSHRETKRESEREIEKERSFLNELTLHMINTLYIEHVWANDPG